jgi:hypothetical protein
MRGGPNGARLYAIAEIIEMTRPILPSNGSTTVETHRAVSANWKLTQCRGRECRGISVSAIFALYDLPEKWSDFTAKNAAYYGR